VFGFDGNEMPLAEAAAEVGIPPMDAKAYLEETLASLRSEKSLQDLVGLKPAPAAANEATPSAPAEKRLFRLTQEEVSQMLTQYPPKSQMHQTIQLAWQGFSARKIATMRGVTYQSVYELLRRFGAEQRIDMSLGSKLRHQELAAEMYQANYTIKEISAALSISPPTIKAHLIASGLLPAPATPQEQAERYTAAVQEPTIIPVSELLKRERQARRERRAKGRKR
jgi:transposase